MTMTPLEDAQARRARYVAAEARILLKAQEFSIGDGSVARMKREADLQTIRDAITEIDAQIAVLTAVITPVRRQVVFLR